MSHKSVNLKRSLLSLLSGVSGNWIEIAYGTSSGAVRVIVQHPETLGSGPQLFQTFTVHRSPVTKIMLSEKHLVSGEEAVTVRQIREFACSVRELERVTEENTSLFVFFCLCQCARTTITFGRGQ